MNSPKPGRTCSNQTRKGEQLEQWRDWKCHTRVSEGTAHCCKVADPIVGLGNMRMANGSQPFRRDSDAQLGRGEGTNETEPFLFPRNTRNDHDHPREELSVHRIQVLARRCAFPFARRIPRVTKRYVVIEAYDFCLYFIWRSWMRTASSGNSRIDSKYWR